jgi:NAD-dependent SIR2 family protein deacetylase
MDVYLLGAGFSSDAGVPTMKNFMCGVSRVRQSCDNDNEKAVLARALSFAKLHQEDNIEKLLLKAINSTVFFDLIWAFGLTIDHLSRHFLEKCQSGEDLGWYEAFARILCGSDSFVLSFNYDLVLEEVLWWRTGCGEDYYLSFDEVRVSPLARRPKRHIPLLKLHGSVSFLWCMECHFSVNRYSHTMSGAYEETPCPRCTSRLLPLLIPPTYRKAVEFGPVLHSLWAKADKLFEEADRLIVCGFSFSPPDSDFRKRFLHALKQNKKLKEVIIVNHDHATCRSIAALLPENVSTHAVHSFEDFCNEK